MQINGYEVLGIGDKLDIRTIHASSGCELPERIELVGGNRGDWKKGLVAGNYIELFLRKKPGDQVELPVGDSDSIRVEIIRIFREDH
jgi:hypothetical protein